MNSLEMFVVHLMTLNVLRTTVEAKIRKIKHKTWQKLADI